MKKILPLLVVFALGMSSCQKDEMPEPIENSSLKILDKNLGSECNCGGGSWDLEEPAPSEPSVFRTADPVSEPTAPAGEDKAKKEKPAKSEKDAKKEEAEFEK